MSFRPMRCRKATGTVIWTSRERQEFRLREIPHYGRTLNLIGGLILMELERPGTLFIPA